MKPKVLIVEDDEGIYEIEADIVEGLDLDHDYAGCVTTAREKLDECCYDCVLLDMELPVRSGSGLARLQNGENLLETILEHPGQENVPVIITTGHGTDSYKLARRLLKKGAFDFVAKPFPTEGDTLDKAIKDALSWRKQRLGSQPSKASVTTTRSAQSAEPPEEKKAEVNRDAKMVFRLDRVELCGVKICDEIDCNMTRKILDALRERRPDGRLVSKSADQLAKAVGSRGGQNTIADAVKRFRRQMAKLFPDAAKLPCPPDEVVVTLPQGGYRINEGLTVEDRMSE